MNKITKQDWEKYFPFSKIRPQQENAINFALNAYINEGKSAVLLELPTGIGKSATGITIARYMEAHGTPIRDSDGMPLSGTYVITTQKILQEQYVSDFGPQSGKGLIRTIKSSSNYRCKFYTDQSCSESKRVLSKLGKQLKGTEFQKQCKDNCTYTLEKNDFIESPLSITNFSYFLAETTYSGKLTPRAMLVIDECHNTEIELGKFIEVSFSEKFARDVLKCKIPRLDSQTAIFEWVRTTYRKSVNRYVKELEKNIVKMSDSTEGYGDYSKQYEMLEKHVAKIDQFIEIYKEDNWVVNVSYPQEGNKRSARKFEFKPVDLSQYSKVLFKSGGRLLMMSATVIDKDIFCSSIGLNPSDVAFLRLPSPFPVENRPIHFLPVGSMSKNSIDKTLPVMAEAVGMILDKHPSEKGIIHCIEENSLVTLGNLLEKRISDVERGEEILTWNESMSVFEKKIVDDVWFSGIKECVDAEFENGKRVVCTPEHKILTANKGWVEAINLSKVDEIVSLVATTSSSTKIKSIKNVGFKRVFDLSVQDNHNFIVSNIVVHNCTNYKITKYLLENVRTGRFLTHDSTNRDEALKKHVESKDPTVLLSPSMMEGIDLADESSRFQIICKVPFPYLGDLVVKKRMEINKLWYPYATAKLVIQSLGRSIRNENDHAISYILDGDWENFYFKNRYLFPEEFRASFVK